ncbi:MAG: hypothetical protein M3Z23_08610 [Acidobacteriota bacterium]|nr:hypothetical protein [Acidobacteriota bacterium]
MAGFAALVKALATAFWRDLRTLNSVATNNFFLFCFLLLQNSGVFLQVILGLILLFPLTTDPLRKIPAGRLDLWPVSALQRAALRIASIWLSPAAWITIGLLLWAARPAMGLRFLVLAVSFHVAGLAFSFVPAFDPRMNPLRRVPAFPGQVGGLIRKNAREMLTILDVYAAIVVSLSGLIYRFAGRNPEPDAFFGLALMVVLALSSYAQCLFGLDSEGGFKRYQLLPLRGWQILLSKDIAFLLLLFVLALPLSLSTALAGGLAALTVGHHTTVRIPVPQAPWRFTGSPSIGISIVQTVAMFGAGGAAYRVSSLVLAPCAAVYLASLWFYGRELDGLATD